MSQKTETICDQCGARKGETNHWWFVFEDEQKYITVYKVPPVAWNSKNKMQDYCSEQCVTRALSEFMGRVEPNQEHRQTSPFPPEAFVAEQDHYTKELEIKNG
jgi:hypothetical protein